MSAAVVQRVRLRSVHGDVSGPARPALAPHGAVWDTGWHLAGRRGLTAGAGGCAGLGGGV